MANLTLSECQASSNPPVVLDIFVNLWFWDFGHQFAAENLYPGAAGALPRHGGSVQHMEGRIFQKHSSDLSKPASEASILGIQIFLVSSLFKGRMSSQVEIVLSFKAKCPKSTPEMPSWAGPSFLVLVGSHLIKWCEVIPSVIPSVVCTCNKLLRCKIWPEK